MDLGACHSLERKRLRKITKGQNDLCEYFASVCERKGVKYGGIRIGNEKIIYSCGAFNQ